MPQLKFCFHSNLPVIGFTDMRYRHFGDPQPRRYDRTRIAVLPENVNKNIARPEGPPCCYGCAGIAVTERRHRCHRAPASLSTERRHRCHQRHMLSPAPASRSVRRNCIVTARRRRVVRIAVIVLHGRLPFCCHGEAES